MSRRHCWLGLGAPHDWLAIVVGGAAWLGQPETLLHVAQVSKHHAQFGLHRELEYITVVLSRLLVSRARIAACM
jgi:hypothetical protein